MTEESFAWLGAPEEYKFYDGAVTLYYEDADHSYYRYDEDGDQVLIPGATTVCGVADKSEPLMAWSANQAAVYLRDKLASWVSSCLSLCDLPFPVLDEWIERARLYHRNVKEDAGTTGKLAHSWLEKYIKALIARDFGRTMWLANHLPEDKRAANGCIAALDWMARHKVRWVFTERKIYSLIHDYAGTCDGLAYISSCGDAECCGEWVKTEGRWNRVPLEFSDVLAVMDWKTSNSLHDAYDWQTASYKKALQEEGIIPNTDSYRFLVRLGKDDAEFESRLLPPSTFYRDWETFKCCLALYRMLNSRKRQDKQQREEIKAQLKADKEAAEEAAKEAKRALKAALKAAKEEMFTTLRLQGLTIKAAKALIKAKFTQGEEDGNEGNQSQEVTH